ncbi:hypothetical protein CEE39_02790 [bacterium (candidate division B38) B3_B38]|nr:MAG: hypothetical protein CEE39_02790 [bacterium (candidate division B38) B3_B38]
MRTKLVILILALLSSVCFLEGQTLEVKQSEHFSIFYPPRHRYSVELLQSEVERNLKRVAADIGIDPAVLTPKISVYLLTRREDFALVEKGYSLSPDWSAGFVDIYNNVIVIKSASLETPSAKGVVTIFCHELTHLLLRAYLEEHYSALPYWFHEGIAMREAKEWRLSDAFYLVRKGMLGSIIPLERLTTSFPREKGEVHLAYLESLNFIIHLEERFGEEFIPRLLTKIREGGIFELSFFALTREHWQKVEGEWRQALEHHYRWIPWITSTSTIWTIAVILFIMGYIKKRRRQREVIKRWEEEDF